MSADTHPFEGTHLFEGSGNLCERRYSTIAGTPRCGEPRTSPVHYVVVPTESDTHLYIASIGDQCEALVYSAGEPERCLEPRNSPVHHTSDPDTVVIALPTFDGFATGERPTVHPAECPACGKEKGKASADCPAEWHPRSSFDAPAEDGGAADGTFWAASAGAYKPLPPLTREQKEGTGAWARWNLENNQPVTAGPWTVRQWYAPDGGAPEAWEMPGELICALNVAGEGFEVQVWWADTRTRMVRVTWGALAYISAEELGAAVESWPESL